MNEPKEQKNYASLRGSKAFGQDKNKISLRVNKKDFAAWIMALPEDNAGCVKMIVAPRITPSDANSFTLFEDTFKPDMNKMRREVAPKVEPKPEDDDSKIPF